MLNHVVTLSLLLSLCAGVRAQGYFFNRHSLPEEFQVNSLNQVYQGNESLLWLGSDKGLLRFNGLHFELFELGEVKSMVNWGEHLIIAGADGSLRALNPELPDLTEAFFTVEAEVRDLMVDRNGRLWVATYGEGLFVFEKLSKEPQLLGTEQGLSDEYIYAIEMDLEGSIYAGTDKGIQIIDIQESAYRISTLSEQTGLPDNLVTALCFDSSSGMWAGTQSGDLFLLDHNKEIVKLPAAVQHIGGAVSGIISLGEAVWLCTEQGLVYELNLRVQSFSRIHELFEFESGRGFSSIIRDDEGLIWICGKNNTLFHVDPRLELIREHEGLPFHEISAIEIDSNSNLWFALGGKLYRHFALFSGTNQIQELAGVPDKAIITDILAFRSNIWVATLGHGILVYDSLGKPIRLINTDAGLTDDNVLSLSGGGGHVWAGTLGGASRIPYHSSGEIETFNEANGLVSNYIYDVECDRSGTVWFATDGAGIIKYADAVFSVEEWSVEEAEGVFYSISASKNEVWFGSAEEGLFGLSGDSLVHLNKSDGLRSTELSSVLALDDQTVLCLHREGLDFYDLHAGQWLYFGKEVGMSDMDPDLNTLVKGWGNEVWGGTDQMLFRLNLDKINLRDKPKTILYPIKVLLETHHFEEKKELGPGQNYLTFEFEGIWFQDPGAVEFQYRLLGLNEGWQQTRDHLVTYPKLPPGEYTFEVRSSADGNFNQADIQSVSFTIEPPFWREVWFAVSLTIFFLSSIYFYIRWRESQIKKRAIARQQQVLFEFNNLRSQVNPHFLFNSLNTLVGLMEEKSDLALSYVEKLSDLFRNILNFKDRQLISLSEELALLSDYLFINQMRYGENLKLEYSDLGETEAYLLPPLTLQILLENAIKHNVISSAKPLVVTISREDERILKVSNPIQRKRQPEKGTGTGLKNVKQRFALTTDAEVIIETKGEEFSILIPLIKS